MKVRDNHTTKPYIKNGYDYNDLVIQPTSINFSGADLEEPIVCKFFGCGKHLTLEESRYGKYCISHNKK